MKAHRLTIVSVFLIFFLSLNSAQGAEADAQRQILEGAKKEGKLVFYTSVETEFARVLTGGFEAKYPFVKTDIFRSSHDKIFSRLNIERKAGNFAADVLSVGEFETYHMQKRGLLTPYKAPSAGRLPRRIQRSGWLLDGFLRQFDCQRVQHHESEARRAA